MVRLGVWGVTDGCDDGGWFVVVGVFSVSAGAVAIGGFRFGSGVWLGAGYGGGGGEVVHEVAIKLYMYCIRLICFGWS